MRSEHVRNAIITLVLGFDAVNRSLCAGFRTYTHTVQCHVLLLVPAASESSCL